MAVGGVMAGGDAPKNFALRNVQNQERTSRSGAGDIESAAVSRERQARGPVWKRDGGGDDQRFGVKHENTVCTSAGGEELTSFGGACERGGALPGLTGRGIGRKGHGGGEPRGQSDGGQ